MHSKEVESERNLPTPVNQDEHKITFWEQKIDAMMYLLANKKLLTDWAPLRAGIETLSVEDYDTLDYYERWAKSAAGIAINQDWITKDELDQRIVLLMKSK